MPKTNDSYFILIVFFFFWVEWQNYRISTNITLLNKIKIKNAWAWASGPTVRALQQKAHSAVRASFRASTTPGTQCHKYPNIASSEVRWLQCTASWATLGSPFPSQPREALVTINYRRVDPKAVISPSVRPPNVKKSTCHISLSQSLIPLITSHVRR